MDDDTKFSFYIFVHFHLFYNNFSLGWQTIIFSDLLYYKNYFSLKIFFLNFSSLS